MSAWSPLPFKYPAYFLQTSGMFNPCCCCGAKMKSHIHLPYCETCLLTFLLVTQPTKPEGSLSRCFDCSNARRSKTITGRIACNYRVPVVARRIFPSRTQPNYQNRWRNKLPFCRVHWLISFSQELVEMEKGLERNTFG